MNIRVTLYLGDFAGDHLAAVITGDPVAARRIADEHEPMMRLICARLYGYLSEAFPEASVDVGWTELVSEAIVEVKFQCPVMSITPLQPVLFSGGIRSFIP